MTEGTSVSYGTIAMSSESTVVAEFVMEEVPETAYQSEAQLEAEFIRLLQAQAYEFLTLHSEAQLVQNLRTQLERLNEVTFSDQEWDRFFLESIARPGDTIADKSVRIQQDHVQLLRRDDGTTKNITLIDKSNIHNNRLQVINQYEIAEGEGGSQRSNRYDVTILVNGIPMVHVELKRRGMPIREAFNQIERYQRDSFWSGSGLYDYVQLFVISNGTLTKYYSNTTRRQHLAEGRDGRRGGKTSHSFEFTSWWADATNRPIQDLRSFTKTFFARHALLNVLTKYCVLTADKTLLVMRPYQIVATERILERIGVSVNYPRMLGTTHAGGYVWHTTGSGKTLTSFKTAQLAIENPSIKKVLFVVDRKDLDYQTMREYDRFEKGAANSNRSTSVLRAQLGDPSAKLIITTIQKLTNFVAQSKRHTILDEHVVIIFDECHRSQFGDMHVAIRRAFKKYNLFGFTGTPIFAENAASGGNPQLKTTEQAFGDKLHTYTIVDAITDKNVLPFRIDWVNTIKSGRIIDKQVSAIDTERALLAPERVSMVIDYILEHFDQKTRRSENYSLRGKRVRGFNALFATASIDAARAYYTEFKRQQGELLPDQRLKVGIIYSYAPNEEVVDGFLDEENCDPQQLPADARTFLDDAIADYNAMFSTNFSTSSDAFQNYYKDLSMRIKDREIDLVIVVNMFLTGFDATTLNTLFVDKRLRSHGLIQAFSRTNRILNAVKAYGNIVSFRNLEEETNDAIALFGNKDARGIVLLRPYEEYVAEYKEKVRELLLSFPVHVQIVGEQAQKDFVVLFGSILRLRNILVSFDDFEGNDPLSPRDAQDYTSTYLYIRDTGRTEAGEKESILDDVVFEIELIKQIEVNVDYILMLVEKYRKERGDGRDKELRAEISRAVDSSPTLRSKKDLIEAFVDSVSVESEIDVEWSAFVAAKRREELEAIIGEENLQPENTRAFVDAAFRDGAIRETGTAITKVLPAVSLFSPDGGYAERKQRVLAKLRAYFERFFGLAVNE